MYLYFWMWRMAVNATKWTFLTFCFCVPSLDLLSFVFHWHFFIWNQHCLGWKISYSYFVVSRGMRLWETRSQPHSEFILLSSQVQIWEYLVLPGFWGLLEEFCLTDTLCRETRQRVLAFTFKENYVKSFLEIFSSERFFAKNCNKVQNSVLSLQYHYN